ncbi:g5533 [Coccomyxa viridis]|uniref:G5533 protein n=1 Tax=Coccomyxa viridis TaxID=1274662 RepID=A0ABP1FT25_9CHLO
MEPEKWARGRAGIGESTISQEAAKILKTSLSGHLLQILTLDRTGLSPHKQGLSCRMRLDTQSKVHHAEASSIVYTRSGA